MSMDVSSAGPFFNYIKANSATEFLQYLDDLASRSTVQSQLIWRGVGRSTYELIPASGRPSSELFLQGIGRIDSGVASIAGGQIDESIRDAVDGCYREYAALIHFCRRANEQALPLPAFGQSIHDILLRQTDYGFTNLVIGEHSSYFEAWPPKTIWPLLGLAQHYGIPTRLLDWSGDCRVAAYFAAINGLREISIMLEQKRGIDADKSISVWMLNATAAERTSYISSAIRDTPARPEVVRPPSYVIHVIDVPYHGNENLAAQRGRFTVVTGRGANRHTTCLSEIMRTIDRELQGKPTHLIITGTKSKTFKNSLCRFDLPYREVPSLFFLLQKQGYDSNRLFPGYSGAARAAHEAELALRVRESIAKINPGPSAG